MTSPRKALANVENAQRSSGPKSAAGKMRSSQNSRRHGLGSRARGSDFDGEKLHLAMAITEECGSQDAALAIAEAFLLSQAVDNAKGLTFQNELARFDGAEFDRVEPEAKRALALIACVPAFLRIDDYDRRASSRLRKLVKGLV